MNARGLTLVEMVLVIIVVSVSAALTYPSIQAGIENRRAKQAAETAKAIAHAVRMYEVDYGKLPSADLSELITRGYIKQEELAQGNLYQYRFVPNANNPKVWSVQALHGQGRTLTIQNTNTATLTVKDSQTTPYTN